MKMKMTKGLRIPVRARIRGVVFVLLFLSGLATAQAGIIEMRDVGIEERAGEMTITLRFTEAVNYRSFTLRNPPRLVVDIPGVILKEPRTIEVRDEVVETISYRQHGPDTLRIVVSLAQPARSRVRKVGNKLLLSLSLPREVRARLLTEERVRIRAEREAKVALAARERKEEEWRRAEEKAEQLLGRGVKREIELKVREREGRLETYLSRGERHYRAHRFQEAIGKFEAVLALEPGNEEARNYLIMTRERKRSQLLAEERAAREEEERREEERRWGEIRHREEERKARIAEHLRRGRGYRHQGRYGEAIFQVERVLALSPGHRPAEELIEELIVRSRKQALEIAERRARVEREMVERQRILDVTRAPFAHAHLDRAFIPRERDRREEVWADLERDREEVEELRKRAEILVAVDFRDTDIREVLLHLSRLSELTIAIDERALAELLDPNVTIFVPTPIPLTEVLGIILRVKGLGYVFREHYIWVSSKERVEERVTQIHRLQFPLRRRREIGIGRRDDDRRENGDRRGRRRRDNNDRRDRRR